MYFVWGKTCSFFSERSVKIYSLCLSLIFFFQIGNPGDQPDFKRCKLLCPNLFNIKCLIFRGCWKRLIQAASTMALIGGVIVVLAVAIKQGWMKRCIKIIECCLPKRRLKRSKHINRRNNDGGGQGEVEESHQDEIITPANKKMNTFADAASAALAAKKWRHYQQQQKSLREQQLQLQLQQQQMALESQLIGACLDPNTTNNNAISSTTSSPTYSPIPFQMMFYSPQTSPGPTPMQLLHPPSVSSPHLTRAQTFQPHMFQSQQQQQSHSPPTSPLRCWNTFSSQPLQQYTTAYNNPLSWQQQQQRQQQHQVDTDDMAMPIEPMSYPPNLPSPPPTTTIIEPPANN
jgi:hypothetical protein